MSFTWSKSFRVFNNFQYTQLVVNDLFSNCYVFQSTGWTDLHWENSSFIFSDIYIFSSNRVQKQFRHCNTSSNFQLVFLLQFRVYWRKCVAHNFQYFLNKVLCHLFFNLKFFHELANLWQVLILTTEYFFLQLVFVSFVEVLVLWICYLH